MTWCRNQPCGNKPAPGQDRCASCAAGDRPRSCDPCTCPHPASVHATTTGGYCTLDWCRCQGHPLGRLPHRKPAPKTARRARGVRRAAPGGRTTDTRGAATHLGLTVAQVRDRIYRRRTDTGRIPSRVVNGRRVFDLDELDRWAGRSTTAAAA